MNRQIVRLGAGLVVCYVALFGMVNYVQVLRADDAERRSPQHPSDRARLRPRPGSDPHRRRAGHRRDDPGGAGEPVRAPAGVPPRRAVRPRHRLPQLQLRRRRRRAHLQRPARRRDDRPRVPELLRPLRRSRTGRRRDPHHPPRRPAGRPRRVARDRGAPGVRRRPRSAQRGDPGDVLEPELRPEPPVHPRPGGRGSGARLPRPGVAQQPVDPGVVPQVVLPGLDVQGGDRRRSASTGRASPASNRCTREASEFDIDFTDDELENFGGSTCGGPLFTILPESCNTAFADMGVNTNGESNMVAGSEAFGFNSRSAARPPRRRRVDVPDRVPRRSGQRPAGPGVDRAGRRVGDAAADGAGRRRRRQRRSRDGAARPRPRHRRPSGGRRGVRRRGVDRSDECVVGRGRARGDDRVSSPTAAARRAAIPGFVVGGKTGTAQLGTDVPSSHAWFISWAGRPGATPEVAVAVLIEAQPGRERSHRRSPRRTRSRRP